MDSILILGLLYTHTILKFLYNPIAILKIFMFTQDFPLPRDMVYFCQPDGTTFTYKRRPAAREKTSFIFTLTDKDSGITRYGICLNFYRGLEKKGGVVSQTENKRHSWKQGTDRSTDSAFSRLVEKYTRYWNPSTPLF